MCLKKQMNFFLDVTDNMSIIAYFNFNHAFKTDAMIACLCFLWTIPMSAYLLGGDLSSQILKNG